MNEITFSYNANFFLFATLENARTMAQGRVPAGPATFPVLTGTPVAGMAYLDRPLPAGYFIFPDLSVRHEGKYRLSFALFEELKEQKDMDGDEPSLGMEGLRGVDAHVSHRLEVKSVPFTVYSAKKFPGLTESTALSRMVAEQGCRVRIRRDVRMRRRENKPSKDWDDFEDETAYERARRTATPDAYGQQAMQTPQPIMDGGERPRSVSNASNSSCAVPQRRPSIHDIGQSYQQGYLQPMPPQQTQNGYGQMPYGASPGHQYPNQYPPPQQQAPPPPPPPPQQQQTMMQPPQAQYQPSPQSYAPQPPAQVSQPYGYMQSPQYPQAQYEQSHHVRHDSMDYPPTAAEYRRAGAPAQPHAQPHQYHQGQMAAPYPTVDAYGRPHHMNGSAQAPPQPAQPTPQPIAGNGSGPGLAPLKTLQPLLDRVEPSSPSYLASPSDPMASQTYHDAPRSGPLKYSSQPQPQQSTGATKRSFASSFDTHHLDQPLRQGARPNIAHTPDDFRIPAYNEEDDDSISDEQAMSYRRADGTQRSRRVPLSG